MTKTNKLPAKRGVISNYQLFFIFLVSRAVVALTFYQAILIGGVSPDSLISSFIALFLNLLLCVPSFLCVKYSKNPLKTKFGRALYLLYFVFYASINISRYAFFACDKTLHSQSPLLFIIVMAAAASYASYLGIEALGRFSVLCAVTSIGVLIIIIFLNFKNFRPINFMPFFDNGKKDILLNSLIFSSNSIEGALYLKLSDRCSEKSAKPLFFGIIASYAAIALMILFCVGVLGKAAKLFSFPIYTLFQMTAFKSFSRLDIIYSAFGFFALFSKCSLLIYCAKEVFPCVKNGAKPALLTALCTLSSLLIYRSFYSEIANRARWFYAALCFIFLVLIPCLYLLSGKRKKDEFESVH